MIKASETQVLPEGLPALKALSSRFFAKLNSFDPLNRYHLFSWRWETQK